MAEFNKTESKENCYSERPVIGLIIQELNKRLTNLWRTMEIKKEMTVSFHY
jgi:hypothetical protein